MRRYKMRWLLWLVFNFSRGDSGPVALTEDYAVLHVPIRNDCATVHLTRENGSHKYRLAMVGNAKRHEH